MLSYVEMQPHSVVAEHSHPHEQVGILLEGKVMFMIGDEEKVLTKGDMWRIPGNVKHKVVVLDVKPAKAARHLHADPRRLSISPLVVCAALQHPCYAASRLATRSHYGPRTQEPNRRHHRRRARHSATPSPRSSRGEGVNLALLDREPRVAGSRQQHWPPEFGIRTKCCSSSAMSPATTT